MHEERMPLFKHLEDLRVAVIRSLVGVIACASICYAFSDRILYWLRRPMLAYMPEGFSFVVLSPYEYFFTELKAGVFLGVVASCPWIFWQIWRFVSPGLYESEKKSVLFVVVSSSIFFVMGVLFAYFFIFPVAFEFFISTVPEGVKGSYSIAMLYGFAMAMMMAFGVVFQTPVLVFMLITLNIISIETIKQYRRIVFVMSFVIGAILTPPDPLTQIMLAIPTYLLFEAGLLVSSIAVRKKLNKETAEG